VHSANKQPDYDAPKLQNYSFRFKNQSKDDSGTYVDPQRADRPVVSRTAKGEHILDARCLHAQAQDLIPVAVAANVQALDLFLPRFSVQVDEMDRTEKILRCHVVGYTRDLEKKQFAPAALAQFPGAASRAVVFLTIGKEPSNSLQSIRKITAEGFEVSIQEIIDGALAPYLKPDGSPVPQEGISLAVGLDMGGILIRSKPKTLDIPMLRIDPPQITLKPEATQLFTAQVTGVPDTNVRWEVQEGTGGAVDDKGLYRAPDRAGTFHVTAVSKADRTLRTTATVTVDKAPEPPPPPAAPIAGDIGWAQAVCASAGSYGAAFMGGLCTSRADIDKVYRIGDIRHGFEFRGVSAKEVPGRPRIDGWCREIDRVTVNNGVRDNVFWLVYRAELTPIQIMSSDWVSVDEPDAAPDSKGPWGYARRESDRFLRSEEGKGYEPVALGDLAVARWWGRPGQDFKPSWRCIFWRGPFKFAVELNCLLVSEGEASGELSDLRRTPHNQTRLTTACTEAPQAGMEYAKAFLDSFEQWYRRPVASGPGPKGLYWPLHIGRYRFKPADLPPGLVLTNTSESRYEWYHREAQEIKVQDANQAQPGPAPGTCYVSLQASYPKEDDPNASAPMTRTRAAIDKEIADIRRYYTTEGTQLAGPTRIALAGADEAVEVMHGYTPKDEPDWRPSWSHHWILARRANVLVKVQHDYIPETALSPSPWARTLAAQVLTRMSADKPAAQTPTNP